MGITDHDSVNGIEEALNAAAAVPGAPVIAKGVELGTQVGESSVHILGYNIDIHNKNLLDKIEEMIFAYICKVGLFGSLCAGMFLTSCMERENEEASKRVIEVGKAISSPAELKASDYFDEIRYVPLETRMIV